MTVMETEELTCELVVKPALYMIEARLPAALIHMVNDYIDRVRDTAGDHAPFLVGQIKQNARSAQLTLDLKEKEPAALASVIVDIANEYIKQLGLHAVIAAHDMWSVHSYAGDYNPLHDHGGHTPLGLSSILYLKVPPVIAEKPAVAQGGAPMLNAASGNCDGYTQFVWGATGMRDFSLLRPPSQQYVKPDVGKLIIFPNWLLHRVEPFFGEGERRTLSCNMDVTFNEPNWY
jgi:hypothetical protein